MMIMYRLRRYLPKTAHDHETAPGPSVGAGLHGGVIEQFVVAGDLPAGGDRPGPARRAPPGSGGPAPPRPVRLAPARGGSRRDQYGRRRTCRAPRTAPAW